MKGSRDSLRRRLTMLEGLLPALGRDAVLRPLLAAPPAAGERLLPAPLLCPHPMMDPLLRNRIDGLVLQVRPMQMRPTLCI